MTDEQALQIRKLRAQGMGYRAIASAANLSRDIVRNYCRSKGIGGFHIEYEMNLKERMSDGRACAFCGADLDQPLTGRPKRFCSEMCRRSYWRIHRAELKKKPTAIYTMECPYCHEIFESYSDSFIVTAIVAYLGDIIIVRSFIIPILKVAEADSSWMVTTYEVSL